MVVGSPLFHQAVPLSRRHRSRITDTLELCCALTGASRPEHNQGSARLYATETPMFEHPYAHPALHGGGKPAHPSSGPLSRHRSRITDTLELCCALTGASCPENIQGSARLYATETPMFEHPYAHPALHGGVKPAHSSSGSPQPTTP
jgi:hypothetical protein